MTESNLRVIEGLISKIESPLQQIRNRAITTLYTKVSAKIITQVDLCRAKQLPGVLFNWINENSPMSKECLYKVLSILHRYTLTEQGLKLLADYEGLEFFEEFRKFLMGNQTNVDEHCDIIKKIIKLLLPLQNSRVKPKDHGNNQGQGQESEQQNEGITGTKNLSQQQAQDSSDNQAEQFQSKGKQRVSKGQQSRQKKQQSQSRQIITFYSISQDLPKAIDQQLYSLMIQLKHGKKQSVLETLIKIEEIIVFWGGRYFKYKEELVRQIVTVIQGKVYSEVACRIVAVVIRQLLDMDMDIGIDEGTVKSSFARDYMKTTKLSNKGTNCQFHKVDIQLKFQIFKENPFSFTILESFITRNKSATLSTSAIEYLLTAVANHPFSAAFLPKLLQKISNNKTWLNQKLHSNKFYQTQLTRMINHSCAIQADIYPQLLPFLNDLFPNFSLQQISSKIPNLSAQLHQKDIQHSFDALASYSEAKGNSLHKEGFDFNLELHHIQTHIKNLQKGIAGLAKKPQLINLYIDFLLLLAVSVAKQDPLMSYYPKIKSLILKVSQHEYLNCRVTLFDNILLGLNSSQKMNYLAESYLKSEVVRLVFSDSDFYQQLLVSALNQEETIGTFLEMTKLIQATTKEDNRKYLNKFSPIFYILSHHSLKQTTTTNPISISPSAKIILSRIPKKHQVTNILLSLFSTHQQERLKTYSSILGLGQGQDLLSICIEHKNLPQKKPLKYSLSTIRNYINIIMNHKIQSSIKASAIQEMIDCSQRIDLALLEKDHELLSQILSIRLSVQSFIKEFIEKGEQGEQLQFFIHMVRIYSILQRRLRLQTHSLNQVIKPLAPEFYLNILINICGGVNQKNLANEKFRNVIPEFMAVVYYHSFHTFTSLLLVKGDSVKELKKGAISLHWITSLFPHEQLIKEQIDEIASVPKRTHLSQCPANQQQSKDKQKLIQNLTKGQKLNIKSHKQLISLYIQKTRDIGPVDQETFQLRRNIICPILERELSNAIHNIASSQGQLAFLTFIVQNCVPLASQHQTRTFFEPLQEMTPHIMNQLLKPNVPEHIKTLLISLSNSLAWKRTKTFDGILNQLAPNQLHFLKLIHQLPKLTAQQMPKIIKITLTNSDNITNFPYTCLLWKTLLKPSNLKTFVLTSSEYTHLLVINSLIKCIQHETSHQTLINFSIILLHQILSEVYFEVKKLPVSALTGFGEFDQNKEGKRAVEMVKLVMSLSIGSGLMSFVLQQFEKNSPYETGNLTLENVCFLLEAVKTLLNLTNFAVEHSLTSEVNLGHENKVIKLFVIQLNEYIRANPEMLSLPSLQMFFSSVLNFANSLGKTQAFCQSGNQVDFMDLALTLFYEKTKLLSKQQHSEKVNKNSSETFLLFCSVLDYAFLKIQTQPSEISHYLLSSTSLIEAVVHLLMHVKSFNSKPEINYLKQVLEKLAKLLHDLSLHQEDYFIFKLHQVSQDHPAFNLLHTFATLAPHAHQQFLICLMRLLLIWQGPKQSKNTHFQLLNPLEFFDEEEDDSSLEERQLFQNNQSPKHPHSNLWIHTVIDLAVQRNQVRHCKTLLALSLPAKMFLIEKPAFLQYIKKMSSLIDSKIIYETTTHKKKTGKKSTLANNSSVLLSNSRRTVLSQNQSYYDDVGKNSSEEEKTLQIQEFTKVLISLFAVCEGLTSSQKTEHYIGIFTSGISKHKDVLRKVFSIVDKLYTLSELFISTNAQNKAFSELFMKLINALSESAIFSQSLSNHLTQVASPMLEDSLSTVLKGTSQPLYQQDSESIKQAIRLLSTLSSHESVRSYIYKNKLVEELNARIAKCTFQIIEDEEKRNDKTDSLNMNSLYDIVGFYLHLSQFKDSHSKILNDKKVLQVLVNQVYMQKSSLVSEKILELLSNLSAFKLNKAIFMQNREIHKTILGQLESEDVEYKTHLLTLMYNLIYRHAPGVKLYKRKDVVETLENIPWEKCQNWDNVKHILSGLMQVLTSESEIPDKN